MNRVASQSLLDSRFDIVRMWVSITISQYFTRDLVKRCSAKNLFGSIAAFTCSPLLAQARRRFFRSADRRAANLGDISSVYVVIEDLTDLEKKLGLTKEIVEARVFAVLRKNGLKPVEGKPEAKPETPHFYNVDIKVVGNACAINVVFMREVTINNGIGESSPFLAITWNLNSLGDLGTNRSSGMDSILDRVSSLTEQFANEFLKANGK